MLIFLIGLPGSGKTTLGKQLARKIGYSFSDLDEMIVKSRNNSIENIFKDEGEAAFRSYESSCLKNYATVQNTVVSTGGGAPCFFDNMDWMNNHGTTVFLNPPLEELASRLNSSENSHRPMLKDKNLNELLSFVELKWNERSPYYSRAKILLDKANPSVNDLHHVLLPFIKNEA
jgi:shikimate kinase